MRNFLKLIHFVLSQQFGLDLIRVFRGVCNTPSFIIEAVKFKIKFSGKFCLKPCLHDKSDSGGDIRGEYFWQDLIVAQMVFKNSPERHLDIGSRIDGFVAHVASFRVIDVCDIRPLPQSIPNVNFRRMDLMEVARERPSHQMRYGSVSCLHVIEHFGLGRYGDHLDVDGFRRGIAGLSNLLMDNGKLYLSTPLGRERVEFNANWVFDPQTIISELNDNGLEVENLFLFDGSAKFTPVDLLEEACLQKIRSNEYNLGLFICSKALKC